MINAQLSYCTLKLCDYGDVLIIAQSAHFDLPHATANHLHVGGDREHCQARHFKMWSFDNF